MKQIKRILLAALVVLSAALLTAPVTIAQGPGDDNQQSESMTLSPASSQPKLVQGKATAGKVTVINNGKTTYDFIVYARPFSVRGESYETDFETVNKYTELYQWVKFPKANFRLAPDESIEVPYEIVAPNDARPGGHYAVIFAETQPPEDSTGQSVARKKRVGSLVYASAAGEVQERGSSEGLITKFWQKDSPLQADFLATNDGNTHYELTSDVVYKNIFGQSVHGAKQTKIIMPGTTRRVTSQWENPPMFGVFKVEGTVSYLGKQDTLQTRYIILLPMKVLIGIALLLAALVVWFVRKKQVAKKKPLKRSQGK